MAKAKLVLQVICPCCGKGLVVKYYKEVEGTPPPPTKYKEWAEAEQDEQKVFPGMGGKQTEGAEVKAAGKKKKTSKDQT